MAREGDDDKRYEGSRLAPSPYVSSVDRQVGGYRKPPKVAVSAAPLSSGGGNERVLMKRTLVAQSKKIQQLTAKINGLETEREAMGQQVGPLGLKSIDETHLKVLRVRIICSCNPAAECCEKGAHA